MIRHSRWFVGLILFVPVLVAKAAEPVSWSAADCVAPDAFVVLEVSKPHVVLDRLFDPRLVEAVTSHPEFQRQQATQDFQQGIESADFD
ncbi:MAG: hypothetical protein JJ992_21860 [Planctomycetes bacterium]|nr:hypothetical protein [Planctomycetota bacterium]